MITSSYTSSLNKLLFQQYNDSHEPNKLLTEENNKILLLAYLLNSPVSKKDFAIVLALAYPDLATASAMEAVKQIQQQKLKLIKIQRFDAAAEMRSQEIQSIAHLMQVILSSTIHFSDLIEKLTLDNTPIAEEGRDLFCSPAYLKSYFHELTKLPEQLWHSTHLSLIAALEWIIGLKVNTSLEKMGLEIIGTHYAAEAVASGKDAPLSTMMIFYGDLTNFKRFRNLGGDPEVFIMGYFTTQHICSYLMPDKFKEYVREALGSMYASMPEAFIDPLPTTDLINACLDVLYHAKNPNMRGSELTWAQFNQQLAKQLEVTTE